MPRSKKSNRRRSTLTKVKAKPKGIGKAIGKRIPKSERFQNSSLTYDEKATQFSNYHRLGLMADANQIGVERDRVKVTGFNPRVKVPEALVPEPCSAPHQLELECPEGLKTIRKVPAGERQVLLKLLACHGEDYGAMARNMRLNQLQHTAAHLRHRIEKMRSEDEEDAEEAAAAAAANAPAPAPRLQRKKTKDPNPAFRKSSKHFN